MSDSIYDFLVEETNTAIHIIEPEPEVKRSMAIALQEEQDLPAVLLTMSSTFEDFKEKPLHPAHTNIVIVDWQLSKSINGAHIYAYARGQDENVKMVFYSDKILGPPKFFGENERIANANTEFVPRNGGLGLLAKVVFYLSNAAAETRISENFVLVQNDIKVVNTSLIKSLARNPKLMYELAPRKFEELIAELFENEGYDVQLTSVSNDGGKDIYAVKRDAFSKQLFAIECKKYGAHNKVGRPLLQNLYGVVASENLSGGILVTSSFFTQPAMSYQQSLANRLFLSDFYDLKKLLEKHEKS